MNKQLLFIALATALLVGATTTLFFKTETEELQLEGKVECAKIFVSGDSFTVTNVCSFSADIVVTQATVGQTFDSGCLAPQASRNYLGYVPNTPFSFNSETC